MGYQVLLTEDAVRDLEELIDYIAAHDGPERADHVLDRVESAIGRLADFPARGSHPPELASVGIRDYREVFFKPYRIIYRVIGRKVYVILVADGRRDMQGLLARRLLRP